LYREDIFAFLVFSGERLNTFAIHYVCLTSMVCECFSLNVCLFEPSCAILLNECFSLTIPNGVGRSSKSCYGSVTLVRLSLAFIPLRLLIAFATHTHRPLLVFYSDWSLLFSSSFFLLHLLEDSTGTHTEYAQNWAFFFSTRSHPNFIPQMTSVCIFHSLTSSSRLFTHRESFAFALIFDIFKILLVQREEESKSGWYNSESIKKCLTTRSTVTDTQPVSKCCFFF